MTEQDQSVLVEGLLKRLKAHDAATAIRAARDLRWVTKQDAAPLDGFYRLIVREAMRTPEARVRWNLILVLGRLPLKGSDRAGVVDWLFERLGDDGGWFEPWHCKRYSISPRLTPGQGPGCFPLQNALWRVGRRRCGRVRAGC